ncbi:carboxypeptidase-like regulatory domain-containing protein [Winogradskyella sp. R77965]|uniref:carboxypeptidase-like regulatory domain-containing protein n=1 Tax=Winogradskyella sp. R77965 TaxID=3093872 RepID=UPI0037DD6D18
MKYKYTFLLLILISSTYTIFAQNSKDILCRIIDIESKYPVSFATVKFEKIQSGVVADEDGEFRLPLRYKTEEKAVIISSIGFATLRVEMSSLKPNTINIIYLNPKVEALGTVVISGKVKSKTEASTAESIVREAISKISINYPSAPHSYMAYYRDYQLVNNKYYNLNEAILENFDAGFQTSKFGYSENVTALYSHNLNKSFYLDSVLLKSIYGDSKIVNKDESAQFKMALENELEMLNSHNPIRNYNRRSFSFVDIFKDNFIDNHLLKLKEIKYIDGTPLHEITFVSKDTENAKFKSEGAIYIAKTNYAIHKFEYRMLQNEKFRHSNSLGAGDERRIRVTERLNTIYEIVLEYKAINKKMYLNYMTFNNRFIIKEPNPFKVSEFDFDPEDKKFYITFNKSVDEASIQRNSRFRLMYRGKKLIIKGIKLIKPNVVSLEVIDWAAGTKADVKKVKSEDFSYKLKRIKDISGATINKESKLLGFQFREFFTQEIFENRKPPSDLIFVNKRRPLSLTRVNDVNLDIDRYWVNSPLKQTKSN